MSYLLFKGLDMTGRLQIRDEFMTTTLRKEH